jgi:hypothetical protein
LVETEKRLAAGRASEVFDLCDGRVLRRFKNGGHPGREALVMEHARPHGFPVPEVFEVRADGLVMEKIEGPTGAASAGLGRLGSSFLRRFLSHFQCTELRHVLRAAAEYRLADENITADEREAIHNLVAAEPV